MTTRIYLYGIFDDYQAQEGDTRFFGPSTLMAQLNKVPKGENLVEIHINSLGGLVHDAIAMCTLTQAWKEDRRKANPNFALHTVVDGRAYSCGAIYAMVGDKVYMAPNSQIMIHCAYRQGAVNQHEVEAQRAALIGDDEAQLNIFSTKTSQSREFLASLLKAETYLTVRRAMELGFVDGIWTNTSPTPSNEIRVNKLQGNEFDSLITQDLKPHLLYHSCCQLKLHPPENVQAPTEPQTGPKLSHALFLSAQLDLLSAEILK
jgi:ATP-dependent protease ClpP protease subunit